MQRALCASKRLPPRATNVFGAATLTDLKAFQRANKLLIDGEYGPQTHAALAPSYDAYGRSLLQMAVADLAASKSQRQLVVAAAMLGHHNRTSIHYTQDLKLRMHGVTEHIRPPRFPTFADCSSFATWCYNAAGAPDPNGLAYNGSGYTGTLFPHGVQTATAAPGDLVFYGGTTAVPAHVAIAVGDGLVVSHGSEIGPSLVAQGYRNDQIGIRSYLPR